MFKEYYGNNSKSNELILRRPMFPNQIKNENKAIYFEDIQCFFQKLSQYNINIETLFNSYQGNMNELRDLSLIILGHIKELRFDAIELISEKIRINGFIFIIIQLILMTNKSYEEKLSQIYRSFSYLSSKDNGWFSILNLVDIAMCIYYAHTYPISFSDTSNIVLKLLNLPRLCFNKAVLCPVACSIKEIGTLFQPKNKTISPIKFNIPFIDLTDIINIRIREYISATRNFIIPINNSGAFGNIGDTLFKSGLKKVWSGDSKLILIYENEEGYLVYKEIKYDEKNNYIPIQFRNEEENYIFKFMTSFSEAFVFYRKFIQLNEYQFIEIFNNLPLVSTMQEQYCQLKKEPLKENKFKSLLVTVQLEG